MTNQRAPKLCPTCGKGTFSRFARAGRTEMYKGYAYELPADLVLKECSVCGEIPMTPAEIDRVSDVLEELHRARLTSAATRAIDTLVREAAPVSKIEASLRLSPGYLSRIRSGASEPSFQLVALLALLARSPKILIDLDEVVTST